MNEYNTNIYIYRSVRVFTFHTLLSIYGHQIEELKKIKEQKLTKKCMESKNECVDSIILYISHIIVMRRSGFSA